MSLRFNVCVQPLRLIHCRGRDGGLSEALTLTIYQQSASPGYHFVWKQRLIMAEAHDVRKIASNCRRLLRGSTTYLATNGSDRNILHELDYYGQRIRYPSYLYNNRDSIRSIVTQQLGLNSLAECDITDPGQWMCGRFNVCIPLDIHGQAGISPKRVIMRFPFPYRVGNAANPGNSDEKILCKAGTYAWLQANCPDITIPNLWNWTGFRYSCMDHYLQINFTKFNSFNS